MILTLTFWSKGCEMLENPGVEWYYAISQRLHVPGGRRERIGCGSRRFIYILATICAHNAACGSMCHHAQRAQYAKHGKHGPRWAAWAAKAAGMPACESSAWPPEKIWAAARRGRDHTAARMGRARRREGVTCRTAGIKIGGYLVCLMRIG